MRPIKEAVILGRLAYGHTPGELEDLKQRGLKSWLSEQLSPPAGDDAETKARLDKATLHIEYQAGKQDKTEWAAIKEDRPLSLLDAPVEKLWPLRDWRMGMDYQERVRPREEAITAAWIRARYSKFQVREVMASFWHDHFHVNALHDDTTIAATWPLYDRIMRTHALGNFREFLEEIAKSPAMLVYLNNRTSRASPANENYARELFELHTLGAEAYLNHLYNRWREVPGATKGKPVGYIDQDVYEAARAFTGWTLADGAWAMDGVLPNTGGFHYHSSFHDPYQKRILGVEIEANAPPLSDGEKVLDLVAFHPATARNVCTKLVRRLIADDPPKAVIDRAVEVWNDNPKSKDQIARVVSTIAQSKEFEETWGAKTKKPMEFFVSFMRAAGVELVAPAGFSWMTLVMGQRLYGWPTPDGAPDSSLPWLSANSMMGRWNGPFWVLSKDNQYTKKDLCSQTPDSVKTLGEAAEFWAERILPGIGKSEIAEPLKEAVKNWAPLETPLVKPAVEEGLAGIAALAALAPQFNLK